MQPRAFDLVFSPNHKKQFTPSKYQQAVFNKLINGNKNIVVSATAGSGKCLGKGTPVLMYDGTIKSVEQIETGDLLMGDDSTPRKVLSLAWGFDDLYKIIPTKGDSWVCNSEHVLTLVESKHKFSTTADGRKILSGEVFDIDLQTYFKSHLCYRSQWKQIRTGVEFEQSQSLPLEPYFAGVWLGDGSLNSRSVIISDDDSNVINYLDGFCQRNGYRLSLARYSYNTCPTIRICLSGSAKRGAGVFHPINVVLRDFVKNGQKIIPINYLTSSRKNRLELLAGLLDTDGYYHANCFEIITKFSYLKDSIIFLARSLGFAAYESKKVGKIKSIGFTGEYWRINISGDFEGMPTLRHKIQKRKQTKNVLRTGFTVKPIGKGEYFGFTLDGNGRFLLGDFTITHNTSTLIEASKLVSGSCLFLAHNRHIVKELKDKLPPHFQCKTVHGIGAQILYRRGIRYKDVNKSKYLDYSKAVAEDILLGNQSQLEGLNKFKLADEIEILTRFCMLSLTNAGNYKEIESMITDFSLDIQFAPLSIPRIKDIILWGNSECLKGNLDYTDMLYFPLMWNSSFPQFDNVFADECQDLSTAQVEILLRLKNSRGKILAVGDRFQSIYKFAGANVNSIDIIKQCLNAEELPLSICYRCPKSHIELAKKIVPSIEAAPNAIEGEVIHTTGDKINSMVQKGDLILCRTIAPLISKCLQLIASKVNAKVKDRNISKQLTNIVDEVSKLAGFNYDDFAAYLEIWSTTKLSRLASSKASEEVIQSYLDRIQGVKTCFESFVDCQSIKELNKEIDKLFSDNQTDVWLSSIHQAKGLEADNIIVLNYNKMPLRWKDQSDDDLQQEYNLKFIALTRSKNKLVLCNG